MSKEKLLKNIELGLLNYYFSKDYSVSNNVDSEQLYEGQNDNYSKLAKQILFKAQMNLKKSRVAKIISIAEATGRLKSIDNKYNQNIFSIFKKHIEQHGLAANYRNFDKMTEEEMGNILRQLDLTSLFDEIDANLGDE